MLGFFCGPMREVIYGIPSLSGMCFWHSAGLFPFFGFLVLIRMIRIADCSSSSFRVFHVKIKKKRQLSFSGSCRFFYPRFFRRQSLEKQFYKSLFPSDFSANPRKSLLFLNDHTKFSPHLIQNDSIVFPPIPS